MCAGRGHSPATADAVYTHVPMRRQAAARCGDDGADAVWCSMADTAADHLDRMVEERRNKRRAGGAADGEPAQKKQATAAVSPCGDIGSAVLAAAAAANAAGVGASP